jgi:predicted O-methyltransferase YrrM
VRDVLDKDEWGYYQFLSALIKARQPQQIVELGGAMGVACVAMLSEMDEESILYSITLPEHGLEFSYISRDYPGLVATVGDDLELSNWPDELRLDRTDLWFIDTLHTRAQLEKELELYSPHFKEGAVVLFDDIKMEELWPVWLDMKWDKYDASVLHVPSGFGIVVI